jgi:hypothetical protein
MKPHIIAAIGALMLFINVFVLETMLFYEGWIMSLGVLAAVFAAIWTVRGGRRGLLFGIGFMMLSVFSYQSSAAYFPPLVILFLFRTEDDKKRVISFLNKAIIAAGIFTLAVLANMLYMRIVGSDTRLAGDTRLTENFSLSVKTLADFLRNCFGFMPNYLFLVFIIIFIASVVFYGVRAKRYFLMITTLLAFVVSLVIIFVMMLPVTTTSWYVFPRSGTVLAGSGGVLILAMAILANKNRCKVMEKVTVGVIVTATVFALIISQRQIDIQQNHYAARQLDMMELAYMVDTIRAYENYYGIIVSQIYFGYDHPLEWFRPQLNNYNDLTLSLWHVPWLPKHFFAKYLGIPASDRPIDNYKFDPNGSTRYVHWFTRGRIVFDNDIVYIVINNIPPVQPAIGRTLEGEMLLVAIVASDGREHEVRSFMINETNHVRLQDLFAFLWRPYDFDEEVALKDVGYYDRGNERYYHLRSVLDYLGYNVAWINDKVHLSRE